MFHKLKPKDIAFAGMYLSIIFIMGYTPYIGFPPVPGGSIALIMIPVIVATIHFGWVGALLGMGTFGFVSFTVGLYMPGSHQVIIEDSVWKWFATAWGGRMMAAVVTALVVFITHKAPLWARMIIATVCVLAFNAIGYIGMKAVMLNSKTFWTLMALSWFNFVLEWTIIPFIISFFYPFFKHVLKHQGK